MVHYRRAARGYPGGRCPRSGRPFADAAGGIARIGQLQLVQPILTLGWSALLLGEQVSLPMLVAAFVVIGSMVLSRKTAVPVTGP